MTISSETHTQTWTTTTILKLYEQPFFELLLQAHNIHKKHHNANSVQLSSLLSIKTGGCPEDCAYCPQSSRYSTEVENTPLMKFNEVMAAANNAKAQGAQRFCMGAAWRSPTEKQLDQVIAMIKGVKDLGLETCVTLGMLKSGQAERLADAGLDYYNHNIDTSPEYYKEIITTRTFEHRLDTLKRVRHAGINVCCGGIIGMGENRDMRAGLIAELANLDPYPESVPINHLVPVSGTALADQTALDVFEFIRTIAISRIVMPLAVVRLSAGREAMDDSTQALCFFAGANSIFYGDQLLTTGNPALSRDLALFERLGLNTCNL